MQMDRSVSDFHRPITVGAVLVGLLRFAWHLVRLPVLMLLAILEPIVSVVLMGLATLGVLMCFFWEFVVRDPHFPFWLMMGISLGFAFLLMLYYALMRLFEAH